MRIKLIELSEDNLQQCFDLNVASDQKQYIASNEESWKTAKDNEKVARPFAIYCDDIIVGFTMFAFDDDYEGESLKRKGTRRFSYSSWYPFLIRCRTAVFRFFESDVSRVSEVMPHGACHEPFRLRPVHPEGAYSSNSSYTASKRGPERPKSISQ